MLGGVHAPCVEGFMHRVWRGSCTVRGGVHAPCVGVHALCMEGFTHRAWGGSRTMHGGFMDHAWRGSRTVRGGSENFKCPPLFVLGYHWLPIATIDLVGNNREIEV